MPSWFGCSCWCGSEYLIYILSIVCIYYYESLRINHAYIFYGYSRPPCQLNKVPGHMANHIAINPAYGEIRQKTYKEILQKASGEYKAAILSDIKKRKRSSEPTESRKRVQQESPAPEATEQSVSQIVKSHSNEIQEVLAAMENELDTEEDPYLVKGTPPHFNPHNYFASNAQEHACYLAYNMLVILSASCASWETRMLGTYQLYSGRCIPDTYRTYKGVRILDDVNRFKDPSQVKSFKDPYAKLFRDADMFETFRSKLIMTCLVNIKSGVQREQEFIRNVKVVEDQKQAMQLDYLQLEAIMKNIINCQNMNIVGHKHSEEKKLSGEKDIKCKLCKNSLRSNDIHTVYFDDDTTGPKICGNCRRICMAWYRLIHIHQVLKKSSNLIIEDIKRQIPKNVIPSVKHYKQLLEHPDNRKSPINVVNKIVKDAMECMGELLVIQIEDNDVLARSMRYFFHPMFGPNDPRGNPDAVQFSMVPMPETEQVLPA